MQHTLVIISNIGECSIIQFVLLLIVCVLDPIIDDEKWSSGDEKRTKLKTWWDAAQVEMEEITEQKKHGPRQESKDDVEKIAYEPHWEASQKSGADHMEKSFEGCEYL